VAKYWNTKRCPSLVVEALECHGGPGYVEESIMPRLYREAPLNSIWEGSGNVMGLDVMRAMGREAEAIPAVMAELEKARGNHPNLDRAIDDLRDELADPEGLEGRMRMVTEMMALTLQGVLLTRHGDSAVAEAFCASRLAPRYRGAFGTLPKGLDLDAIISRALPG
jgi:putative acyl-CoA dehydrogenase